MSYSIFILASIGVSVVIIILFILFYHSKKLAKIEQDIIKVVLRLNDESYTLWRKKYKEERENAKLKRLLKKAKEKK